jgi:hypothetical protein
MKTPKYKSLSKQDTLFKIDDFGDGFSGFVQPGSGYTVGIIEYENEAKVYITNTGSTELKFNLTENGSYDLQLDYLIVQPGKLITLHIDKRTTLSGNILHVTNLHPEKEGSFVVLIINGKKKELQIENVIS